MLRHRIITALMKLFATAAAFSLLVLLVLRFEGEPVKGNVVAPYVTPAEEPTTRRPPPLRQASASEKKSQPSPTAAAAKSGDELVADALVRADRTTDREEAVRLLASAAEAMPDDALVMEKLVDELRAAKRHQDAAAAASAFLATCRTACGSGHIALAQLVHERGDLDEALLEARAALEDPSVREAALRKMQAIATDAGDSNTLAEALAQLVEIEAAHLALVEAQGEVSQVLQRALAEDRSALASARAELER